MSINTFQAYFVRRLLMYIIEGNEWQDKIGFAFGVSACVAMGAMFHPLAAYTYLAGSIIQLTQSAYPR